MRDMEIDSIDNVFESLFIYEKIALFVKQIGAKRVIDIGCAFGHQSEVFLNEGIHYIGVDEHQIPFWNAQKFDYIVGNYPCPLPVSDGDITVSVFCLTWNCYLHEREKTLKEQCEALQRDFQHCLLYLEKDKVEYVSRYFRNTERIDNKLYYFSNR